MGGIRIRIMDAEYFDLEGESETRRRRAEEYISVGHSTYTQVMECDTIARVRHKETMNRYITNAALFARNFGTKRLSAPAKLLNTDATSPVADGNFGDHPFVTTER